MEGIAIFFIVLTVVGVIAFIALKMVAGKDKGQTREV
jgi:hypothetical protein